MPLVLADRVRETTTVAGTGTATLLGAVTGFQSFAVVGNANTTYYCIAGQGTSEWEVGIGTYTLSGTTLARTTVLASSNAGALVTFSAGIKDVFVTYPAGYSVNATNNAGTAGQILASNGTGTAPTWETKITQGTAVASTSGTAIPFTGIPATAKRITVMFNGVSTSGSSNIIIQLGFGATPTYVTTGYLGAAGQFGGGSLTNNTTGLLVGVAISSAVVLNGSSIISSFGTNIWVMQSSLGRSDSANGVTSAGSISVANQLTAIRVTTAGGTDTFDAGSINVLWE